MKKILLCLLLCALMLWGCSPQSTVCTVKQNGTEYVIDTQNNTITSQEIRCAYTLTGNAHRYGIHIVFPNGAEYSYSQNGENGVASWSDNCEAQMVLTGEAMAEILYDTQIAPSASRPSSGILIAGAALLALGLFHMIWPKAAWNLRIGWYFRDAGPSDAALVISRIAGGFLIAAAIVLVFL